MVQSAGMAVVLALISAVCYGSADFSGGYASRHHPLGAVLVWSQLAGLAVVGLFLAVDTARVLVSPTDLLWGAAAGLAGVGGLLLLYRGLARGYASVVSPLAAVVGVVVPVVFAVALGDRLPVLAWAGVVLCVPGITLLSWNRQGAVTRRDPGTLRFSALAGATSGALFGLFFVVISMPGPHAGMWPLAAARAVSLTVLVAAAWVARGAMPLAVHRGWGAILLAGILDMGANIAYVVALRFGMFAVVTVITSGYPAQTVMLSRVMLGERIGVLRGIGIAITLVGIALISAGSPAGT